MLPLTIKDIRNALEEMLRKYFDFADYQVTPTKVIDKDKEFRIEFKIYDAGFRMVIDPSISGIYIGTKSFGEPDHVDSLMIWLEKPYQYDTKTFDFGWRKDLELFFDALQEYLVEKVKAIYEAAVDRCDAKTTKKASIFNGLDEKDNDPVKITAFREDNLMNYLEEEEAASYEEYLENPPKTSIFNSLKDDDDDEYI